jgi:type I restriction enzyme, S subunit
MTQTEMTPTTSIPGKWKRYSAYKDSGVEWLREIPAHWEVKRLKYVAPSSTAKLNEKPDDLPYLGLENIESQTGRLLLDTPIENVDSTVGVFDRGNVLFGKLRPYLAKAVCVDFSGVCTTELLVLQPNTIVNGKFLFYRLLSEDFIKLVNSLTYGTKMPRASSEQIGNIPISLPTVVEQRVIAVFLDRETTRINALIAKKERLIELLQEKRAALISHAVTKGLDPSVPMKDSGVEWLGEIPEHWEVKRLKFAASFYGGGTPYKDNLEYWSGNIPWVSPKDMKAEIIIDTEDHITKDAIENSSTRLVQSGAVLLVVRSGILRHSIPVAINNRPVALNQDMKAIVSKSFLVPEYLASVIRSHQDALLVEWRKEGATVESIEYELLVNTTCPIPTISEQQAIATYLKSETAKIDALIFKVREGIEKLKEYSTALISAAVTGKIDVRGEIISQDDGYSFKKEGSNALSEKPTGSY